MKTVKELLINGIRPMTLTLEDGREITGPVSEYRVRRDIETEGKYLYDIRHSDNDWCDPATLEKNVVVNWFGTMILDSPIELLEEDKNAYLEITDYSYDDE